MTTAEPPVIGVVRRRSGPDREHLVVECPYCPHEHLHGVSGPNLGDGDGHRVAGCWGSWKTDNPGYILREMPAAAGRGTQCAEGAHHFPGRVVPGELVQCVCRETSLSVDVVVVSDTTAEDDR